MTERQIIVVDTETTGLDPERHIVVEVAWVNLNTRVAGMFVPRHDTGVALAGASIEALRVNRYLDRIVDFPRDGTGSNAALLADQLQGATLAGSNPAFDAAFLASMYRKQYAPDQECEPPAWHHRLLDLSAYAAGVLRLPLSELPGLSTVCELLDVENEAPHTALGDARATAECFRRLGGAR
jgi:DNA polymerase-3 subunit epsilon